MAKEWWWSMRWEGRGTDYHCSCGRKFNKLSGNYYNNNGGWGGPIGFDYREHIGHTMAEVTYYTYRCSPSCPYHSNRGPDCEAQRSRVVHKWTLERS